MELPPQGRITDTTPDEWFADIMPFYSMVLLAQELLARIREEGPYSQLTAQLMALYDRNEKAILRYHGNHELFENTRKTWRQSSQKEYAYSTESQTQGSFDLSLGPKEDFIGSMQGYALELLRDKMAEEELFDPDRMHRILRGFFG